MYFYKILKQDNDDLCLEKIDDDSYEYQSPLDYGDKLYLQKQELHYLMKAISNKVEALIV